MTQKEITSDNLHQVPTDLRMALASTPHALAAWEDINYLRVMNGYVGLNPLKNKILECDGLKGRAMRLLKESADHVVGLAVLIVN
jgi:hypothetical protein